MEKPVKERVPCMLPRVLASCERVAPASPTGLPTDCRETSTLKARPASGVGAKGLSLLLTLALAHTLDRREPWTRS